MDHRVITISREFGSGGRLIGKRLAERLGIPCYDRTIIQRTAERSGLSPEFIARAEERARSRFHLSVIPMSQGSHVFANPGVSVSHQAFFAQAEVIRELAAQPCVIVGRCSDYILSGRPDCLRIFLHARPEDRARRCVEEYHLPAQGIEAKIKQTDRSRSNYYNYYTGQTWGDVHLHDLTLNSSITGIDGAVELIARLVELGGGEAGV